MYVQLKLPYFLMHRSCGGALGPTGMNPFVCCNTVWCGVKSKDER